MLKVEFNNRKLEELQIATGLGGFLEINEALAAGNISVIRAAYKVGTGEDLPDDEPIFTYIETIIKALGFCIFGPDGPPEVKDNLPLAKSPRTK